MGKVKAKVIPAIIGMLGFPKLKKYLQQCREAASEVRVQKSALMGTVKILSRTPQPPRPLLEEPKLRKIHM